MFVRRPLFIDAEDAGSIERPDAIRAESMGLTREISSFKSNAGNLQGPHSGHEFLNILGQG